MNEAEFQTAVLRRCRSLNLRAFHSTDSRLDIGPGFPDLLIAGPGGQLFWELKDDYGVMRPEQTTWQYVLLDGGAKYAVKRPLALDTGEIDYELSLLARS